MWGEFDDGDKKDASPHMNEEDLPQQSKEVGETPKKADGAKTSVTPLRDRILHHIASSSLTLKSQQRYEPELTYEERIFLVGELLEKPGQFLYRFGKHLEQEHFQYFLKFEGDPEVDHYVAESLKYLNKHTSKIRVRNRRYAAMQKLRHSGTYFSEEEMERRNPLLYHQLIAQHQTEEEKQRQRDVQSESGNDQRFSSLLLRHFDNCSEKKLKERQEEEEDNMFEEEDTDEEEEGKMEEIIASGEKQLFREEFYSSVYHDFLRGKDDFDYSQVDASDDYDLLDIRTRDEEERYFEEDDDIEESPFVNKDNDADDSTICCG